MPTRREILEQCIYRKVQNKEEMRKEENFVNKTIFSNIKKIEKKQHQVKN